MKIFITGGTGFIGRHLVNRLTGAGHRVSVLTRSKVRARPFNQEVSIIEGDPTRPGSWQQSVGNHDVIINLAGTPFLRRWTSEAKRMIRESRILATRHLVEAMAATRSNKPLFFSASGVGYYGFHGDEELSEASSPGDDFLALLARDWEEEALKARGTGARVIITRFGVVLGRDGGALGKMVPIFRAFLGGPLGDGKQWISWIHIEDLLEAFLILMDRPDATGPVNFVAPYPVRNRDFSIALGRELHRPSIMPAPGCVVRLLMGELGSTLLNGQRVLPGVLLDAGFSFRYPTIDVALQDLASTRKRG